MRWTSQSRQGVGTFAPLLPDPMAGRTGPPGSVGSDDAGDGIPDRDGSLGESIDDLRRDSLASGSLGALQYVLRGIESLPGRKSVVFVSEGFDLGLDARSGRVTFDPPADWVTAVGPPSASNTMPSIARRIPEELIRPLAEYVSRQGP